MDANEFFIPATTVKSLKGKYIVYRSKQSVYYANPLKPGSSEIVHKIALCDGKQGDFLRLINATGKGYEGKVRISECYVTTAQIAEKWPCWETMGDYWKKSLSRDELIELVNEG